MNQIANEIHPLLSQPELAEIEGFRKLISHKLASDTPHTLYKLVRGGKMTMREFGLALLYLDGQVEFNRKHIDSDTYYAGRAAYSAKLPAKSNPHQVTSGEWGVWNSGWQDAKYEWSDN